MAPLWTRQDSVMLCKNKFHGKFLFSFHACNRISYIIRIQCQVRPLALLRGLRSKKPGVSALVLPLEM